MTAEDPGFTASIDSRSRLDIEKWLGREQFDLGITVLPLDNDAIDIEPIVSVRAVAVMRHDHPLAETPTAIHVADLRRPAAHRQRAAHGHAAITGRRVPQDRRHAEDPAGNARTAGRLRTRRAAASASRSPTVSSPAPACRPGMVDPPVRAADRAALRVHLPEMAGPHADGQPAGVAGAVGGARGRRRWPNQQWLESEDIARAASFIAQRRNLTCALWHLTRERPVARLRPNVEEEHHVP